jgi:hypothetical protein
MLFNIHHTPCSFCFFFSYILGGEVTQLKMHHRAVDAINTVKQHKYLGLVVDGKWSLCFVYKVCVGS